MLDSLTEAQISERLSTAQSRPTENPYPAGLFSGTPEPASVLIPLLKKETAWHVLFIRRTHNTDDRHSGQVAFPGGRCNPGDPNPETAALREAQEEIGLRPTDVRILGRLNKFMTVTNYIVTPVVGVIPWPYDFHPAPDEVSRVFSIPLSWLADPGNHERRTRSFPPDIQDFPVVYFSPYKDEILWGASARIILGFLDVIDPK